MSSETLTKLTKRRGSKDFRFSLSLYYIVYHSFDVLALHCNDAIIVSLVHVFSFSKSYTHIDSIRFSSHSAGGFVDSRLGLAKVTTLHQNVGLNKRPPSEHLLPTNFFIQLRVYKSTGERRARAYLRAPTKVQELPARTHNCVSHGCLR